MRVRGSDFSRSGPSRRPAPRLPIQICGIRAKASGWSPVARCCRPYREVYRQIERHADADTVVAASGIAFGARIAQERLGVPLATVHLQPSIVRSLVDGGMAGTVRISESQPMWFKRAFFRLADWMLIDRALKAPINAFRAIARAETDRSGHASLDALDRARHRILSGLVRATSARLAGEHAPGRISAVG